MTARVRIAVVNDYEIVVAGVRAMLAGAPGITLVDLDAGALSDGSVDVVLYDSFGQRWHDLDHLEDLAGSSRARVAVFTWTFGDDAVERALAAGASGYLSKALRVEELVDALLAVHAGDVVVSRAPSPGHDPALAGRGAWPGQSQGLSARESEIMTLITEGLTNPQVAASVYLSVNTVKTYIRTAYRKLGIERRPQAVRYGMEHGYLPVRTSAVRARPS